MKKLQLFMILSIIALLFSIVPLASAGAPPGNWASGIACQNLDDTESASITLIFYSENNSTPALSYDDPTPIPPNGSRNYYTPSTPPGVPDNFLGSVVVSSNTEIACNVNTQTTSSGSDTDPYRIATSSGLNEAQTAPTIYAPQVMKNLAGSWSSYIAVQNTTASDVLVTVSYKDTSGASIGAATENVTIKGNSNRVFYQTDNSNLPDGFIGAATISSDDGSTNLAVTVNFYNAGTSSSTSQLHSYNGFSGGANKSFIPRIVRNFYGYNGGLSIQNVGNSTTTVTISFNFAGNTYVYNSGPINSGAALALYAPSIPELNPVDTLPVQQRFGSATIQAASGGEIVAIVNEDNRGGSGIPAERAGQGSTYNAIPDGDQSQSEFFAQVTRKAGGYFSGGFQVSNTTATAGTCDITYAGVPAATENDVPLPANGSIPRYAPSVSGLPDGFNSSVSVECTQDIVGISNLAAEPGSGKFGDSFTQGNGLNR